MSWTARSRGSSDAPVRRPPSHWHDARRSGPWQDHRLFRAGQYDARLLPADDERWERLHSRVPAWIPSPAGVAERRARKRWLNLRFYWSGRCDSNTRPLAPHASTLPGCATPRRAANYIRAFWFLAIRVTKDTSGLTGLASSQGWCPRLRIASKPKAIAASAATSNPPSVPAPAGTNSPASLPAAPPVCQRPAPAASAAHA